MTLDGGNFALGLLCSFLPKNRHPLPFLLSPCHLVFVLHDKSRHNAVFSICDWNGKWGDSLLTMRHVDCEDVLYGSRLSVLLACGLCGLWTTTIEV